jgi:hypothetical protein
MPPKRGTMVAAMTINVTRVIGLLIMAIVIAGLVNVYADAGPIERMARARVCERHGAPCRERLGRVLRTPFFHELDFVDGGKPVTVRCSRSFIFVGDYGCAVK